MVFSIPVFKELEDLVKGLQRVKVVREASSYPHICTKLLFFSSKENRQNMTQHAFRKLECGGVVPEKFIIQKK